jgi:hypothetical protein
LQKIKQQIWAPNPSNFHRTSFCRFFDRAGASAPCRFRFAVVAVSFIG